MASYSIGRYSKSGGMGWIIASVNETSPSTKELVRSRMKSRVGIPRHKPLLVSCFFECVPHRWIDVLDSGCCR